MDMKIAQCSDEVRREFNRFMTGGLPEDLGTYYSEFIVNNFMGQDVYIIDTTNTASLVAQYPGPSLGPFKYLEIRIRSRTGPRTFDKHTHIETSVNRHMTIQISYDTLRKGPVYIEEINRAFCLDVDTDTAAHPLSENAKNRVSIEQEVGIGYSVSEAPVMLIANDPTGTFKELIMEIGDYLCTVPVTNIPTMSDNIILGVRDSNNKDKSYTRYITQFSKLLQEDKHIWKIGGFTIASNKTWIQQLRAKPVVEEPMMIPITDVDHLVEKVRIEDAKTITKLEEEVQTLKFENKILEANFKKLKESGYTEKSATIELEKLDLEKTKIRQTETQIKTTRTTEFLKFVKEIFTSVAVVAKAAVVLVPLIIGFLAVKRVAA